MDVTRRKAIQAAMVRLSDGDRSAIRELVEELWPVILNFARRGVSNDQDAEDVAQEVFLRICSRIADFDRERDGLSWAFGIARYEILTQRRRQARRREDSSDTKVYEHPDAAASQEDDFIERELLSEVHAMVGTLSDDDRLSLGLATAPAGGAAASGATLRKRRQRALDRLRNLWRKVYGEP